MTSVETRLEIYFIRNKKELKIDSILINWHKDNYLNSNRSNAIPKEYVDIHVTTRC